MIDKKLLQSLEDITDQYGRNKCNSKDVIEILNNIVKYYKKPKQGVKMKDKLLKNILLDYTLGDCDTDKEQKKLLIKDINKDIERLTEIVGSLMISQFKNDQEQYRKTINTIFYTFFK
tara:strand:+ start:10433 stop:10786 length:354 start_codon:yes stop_codon:yes gene_type:complete